MRRVLPNTPGWAALATKVGKTLRHRYHTAHGAFKERPKKRRRSKTRKMRKAHLQLPKIPTRKDDLHFVIAHRGVHSMLRWKFFCNKACCTSLCTSQ